MNSLDSAAGSLISTNKGSGDATSKGPSSRYDPKAMSRIVDITDLVDEADSDDDEEEVIGHSSGLGGVKKPKSDGSRQYGPGGIGGGKFMIRQALILMALVGIIVAASLAIGFAVPSSFSSGGAGGDVVGNEQQLFETAERVVMACSESALDESMKECQKICKVGQLYLCFDAVRLYVFVHSIQSYPSR